MALFLLLLLGHSLNSGMATCSIDRKHCVCNATDISNLFNMLPCIDALELELKDGRLDVDLTPGLEYLPQIKIHKLIFRNVNVSFVFLSSLISALSHSVVDEISIISSNLEIEQATMSDANQCSKAKASQIKTLHLENVTMASSLLKPSNWACHQWLLSPLNKLDVVRCGLAEIECHLAGLVEKLTDLDLSENRLSETNLQKLSNCSLQLQKLTSLSLRDNNLTSLQPLCEIVLRYAPTLANLDVSGNSFPRFHRLDCFEEIKALRRLNLSRSGLTKVESPFPKYLEVLDLSHNALEVFHSPPQGLKELFLSHNQLIRLPSLDGLSTLSVLHVNGNQLSTLLNGTDKGVLEQLRFLRAGGNPYQCDCGLRETWTFLMSTAHNVQVEDWPEVFVCATPVAQEGIRIFDLPSPERCVNPTSGAQSTVSLYCLFSFLCWFIVVFDS